jgi:hypothetical protein
MLRFKHIYTHIIKMKPTPKYLAMTVKYKLKTWGASLHGNKTPGIHTRKGRGLESK